MRLLSSTDVYVRFSSFDGPGAVDGGYAILSHVWQDVEQSFYEMAALEDAHATVDDPRVSIKAREYYRLAQTYGLPWVWIDAPCIDKRNSAELSEAIRSMHGWYAKASICFSRCVYGPTGAELRSKFTRLPFAASGVQTFVSALA